MLHKYLFFDIVSNIISFLILELFVSYFSSNFNIQRKNKLRIIFLSLNVFYSLIPIGSISEFSSILLHLAYILFSTNDKLISKLMLTIKFNIFMFLYSFIASSVCHILFKIFNIEIIPDLFMSYFIIIISSLIYILLHLYINSKNLSSLKIHTKYQLYFMLISLFSILTLIIMSLLLCSNIVTEHEVIPITFVLIVIIIIVTLSTYRSIVTTLKNEVTQSMLLENERLEKDYYRKVNDSLQSLNTLKHDFKNHIAIINHYAENGEDENLCQYLQKISDTIGNDTLVRTPHPIVSTILSVKKQDCIEKGIQFQHSLNFGHLYISDFDITTILGNILDNAITAALKCENPNIFISIQQLDSYLEIDCKNNHMENLKKTKGGFLSTKKDQNILHGIGLKNVDNAVRRLNGRISFTYDSETFEVNILFPNYES